MLSNYAVCNAKEDSRKQSNSPDKIDRKNLPISSEHDLTFDRRHNFVVCHLKRSTYLEQVLN